MEAAGLILVNGWSRSDSTRKCTFLSNISRVSSVDLVWINLLLRIEDLLVLVPIR